MQHRFKKENPRQWVPLKNSLYVHFNTKQGVIQMLSGYDTWKTTPPERKQIHAMDCHHCKTEMFIGDKVLHDCVTGEKFCSKDCVKAYIKENLDDFMEELLDRDYMKYDLNEEDIA